MACKLVETWANVVDQTGVVTGEKLERDERGAATRWALVLEAAAQ